MRNLLLFFFSVILILSCKKEAPLDPNTSGETEVRDVRGVRILKVEQTKSPNTYPFISNTLATVEYHYNDDQLEIIVMKKDNGSVLEFDVVYKGDSILINLPNDSSFNAPYYNNDFSRLRMTQFKFYMHNNQVVTIENDNATFFNPIYYGRKERKVFYSYNSDGGLKGINSKVEGELQFPINIEGDPYLVMNTEYDRGLLKKYDMKYYAQFASGLYQYGRDLNYSIEYKKAYELPDGLVQLVNQAVMGITNLGFEDYLYHWVYDIDPNSETAVFQNIKRVVKSPNYAFADWIISFGFPHISFLPSSQNNIVTTKRVRGKVLNDIAVIDASELEVRFKDIDSITTYNYHVNMNANVLEIAGLKIHYEIIE